MLVCADSLVSLEDIESKRKSMIQAAFQKGFTNEETIKQSQELDRLIYKYQCQRGTGNPVQVKMKKIVYSLIL